MLSIFNIYNDCTQSRNKTALRRFVQDNTNILLASENHHMIWAGDFNRHHPLWDRDEDVHLFTQQATRQAEGLINLLATYDLDMSLPKLIPTLQRMVTKRYSRPDNIFSTPGISELITKCEVDPSLRPT
jgi:endonuclease/exonuclease/phosphatase family metal-dependent hydrolase